MDISDDDLRACVRVLQAIEADRSHLPRLTQGQRRELLTLAGLVAKPERHHLVKMAKAFRRAERTYEAHCGNLKTLDADWRKWTLRQKRTPASVTECSD